MSTISFRKSSFFRFMAFTVLAAFFGMLPASPSYAQVSIVMSPPGQMLHVTQHFEPPQMVGLKINLKDPFSFGFIMDQGQSPMSYDVKKAEFNKIIKYFLVSLAMPNKDMWVNLSPYESKRIIPEVFGQTEMGRDLLAQDYILKQFTASLMYPENGLGKEFWDKVYAQAQARFGTTDINVNTFNKVWIVADHADVYQKGDTAFLVGSHLKVMLEQDYMAIEQNKEQFGDVNALNNNSDDAKTQMASQIVREIIIPAIEKEVNEGRSFAAVRQIYNAEIMATWFKKTLRESLLGQVFANKSKIAGQMVSDPQAKEKIFEQYLRAYKRGVFNYIKREETPDGQIIPRRYLSGGMEDVAMTTVRTLTPADFTAQAAVQELAEKLSKARERGAEAYQTAIGERFAASSTNTSITPMDLLETFAKMPMPQVSDNSRTVFMATLLSHLTQPNLTNTQREIQIPQLANQLRTEQGQQWPAVQALLKKQQQDLTVPRINNTPIPQPTAMALVTTIAQSTMPEVSPSEHSIMLATLMNQLTGSTPRQEVNSWEESARNKTLDLAMVDFDRAQEEPVAIEQPAVTMIAEALGSVARNQASTQASADMMGEMLARMANPPTVNMADLKEQARNFSEQYTTHLSASPEAAHSWVEQQLTTTPGIAAAIASPRIMADVLNSIAMNQASTQASADMMGEMLARMGNPPTVNMTDLKEQARNFSEQYTTHLSASPEAAHSWVEQQLTTTPGIAAAIASPIIMAGVLNSVARNQASTQASADMMGEILARMANMADLKEQARNLAEQYSTHRTASPEAAHNWVVQRLTAQLSQQQGLASSMRSIQRIQQALPGELEQQIRTHKAYMSAYIDDSNLRTMGGQGNERGVWKIIEPLVKSGEIQGNIEEAVRGIMAIARTQNEEVSRVAEELRRVVPKAMVEPVDMVTPLAEKMVSKAINDVTQKRLGGINLSDEHLTMNIKVDGAGMPLPPQDQDPALMNLNGLVSIIRSITPITQQNLPELYELAK